ncbi:MAG: aquaporin [bacterium]|nr:aquaporin [bacterium]
MNGVLKSAIAELLGTFTLVFVGGMVVTVAPQFGVVAAALGHGLILIGIIYAYGHISGAHFNPAVTAGLLVGGKIDLPKAVIYWVMQFVGAIIAAVLVRFFVDSLPNAAEVLTTINYGVTKGSLTDDAIVPAALIEFILAFLLVSTIYQAAVFGKAGNLAPVAIGFTLAGLILAAGAYTGASVNPARTLGPALIAGDLSYVPAYFVALFAGGIVAGLLHAYVIGNVQELPPKVEPTERIPNR